MPTRILLIGKSGRLDCLADALYRSPRDKEIFIASEVVNPGLVNKSVEVFEGITDDPSFITECALKCKPDFAVIGPEEPLAAGIVDALADMGIPSVGPCQLLAQLESSKAFTRELLTAHNIPGNPEHRVFRSVEGLAEYMRQLGEFVIKPDGLTGGKGVQVFGDHFQTVEEGLQYCVTLFDEGQRAVVIEEKLDGEEFSYQSLFDGTHIVHTMPIQDHKRAHEGDKGPNTGGMGSYSFADHKLPFISDEEIEQAKAINLMVGQALLKQTGIPYKGILYGGFMVTKAGLRVIEYNARFGDPEVMNVIALLKGNFIDVCEGIIAGTLNKVSLSFEHKATVCKYVVPKEYPGKSSVHDHIDMAELLALEARTPALSVYYAAVKTQGAGLYLTGSRAIAVVATGDTLVEAEKLAEKAVCMIGGNVRHRSDIGTADLLQKRVDHMDHVRHGDRYEQTPARIAL